MQQPSRVSVLLFVFLVALPQQVTSRMHDSFLKDLLLRETDLQGAIPDCVGIVSRIKKFWAGGIAKDMHGKVIDKRGRMDPTKCDRFLLVGSSPRCNAFLEIYLTDAGDM